jgi:CHASE2 domain-containing sensor protein/serine phosphatase RsbU (regulator of sigma subunit)
LDPVSDANESQEPAQLAAWSDARIVQVLRRSQGRPFGLLLLTVLVAVHAASTQGPIPALRLAMFDTYQRVLPRQRQSAPAVIVAIDEDSLARFGQWPWPRTMLARLIERIGTLKPAAIGVDIIMPEPDRHSPHRLAETLPPEETELSARLKALPDNDEVLASTVASFPVSLGVAGLDEESELDTPPHKFAALARFKGGDPRPYLQSYGSALCSHPAIHNAARGHGLLSVEKDPDGTVRRLPLVGHVEGTTIPSLSLDMLRLALDEVVITVRVREGGGVQGVDVGELQLNTERDGAYRVHFSRHLQERYISAVDVLDGRVRADEIESKLVLIGVTGLGLVDYPTTPVEASMPGVEAHAQLLENIFDGTRLYRPAWAGWAEAALVLALGATLITTVPALSPKLSPLPFLLVLLIVQLVGWLGYAQLQRLFDAGTLSAETSIMYVAMLGISLAETDSHRRRLKLALEREKEAAAKLAGELGAARSIQMGLLPNPTTFTGTDARFELDAMLEPAALVGGDLYDFFMLDRDRLFFLVGDVSGKGVPASLFMALSKTLTKSVMLREPPDMSEAMAQSNKEIVRDNPEMLFVTVFAGVLDLRSGELRFCRAGHELPLLVSPGNEARTLQCAGGPPLGLVDELHCPAGRYRFAAGETICLFTDGVTEAMNVEKQLYGMERARKRVSLASHDGPAALVRALYDDIKRFAAGAPPSDDITILAVRWLGGASSEPA